MAVQTTVNFKWYFKKKGTGSFSKTDVSIRRTRQGINIHLRNNAEEYFMPEGYLLFGVSGTLLGLMKSDRDRGYKLSKLRTTAPVWTATITDPDMVEILMPFVGNYDIEFNEVNQMFIDRRHVK